MIFKGLIAATAAVALAASPAVAASNGASMLSVAPAAESVDGSQMEGGGNVVIIVLALIAAGLGLWVIIDDGGDRPTSP